MHIEQKTNRIFRPTGNTTLSAEESNQVTTELENLITAGTLTPSAGTLTQVRDSVNNLIGVAANNLQQQIDAITAASDVFDVVGTYAELQAYDKTTVPINDIIKVLQDSTHNNAATYYRLEEESGGGTDWTYIGQEGPYYTKSEIDTDFATKAELPGVATTQQVGLVKPDGQSVTVAQDGTLSVSSNVAASLPLFTSIWADHILNDTSYLRSDTFSWQSGSVYTSAYNHLVADISGITAETETISGTTITFYRATDGHKIVLADQESNVSAIYTATGVAWYYILDTVNTRFKLPRINPTKEVLQQTAPVIGNGIGIGLTDGTYKLTLQNGVYGSHSNLTLGSPLGASVGDTLSTQNTGDTKALGVVSEAANSGLIADLSSATGIFKGNLYLYFYVGNTVQDQTTIDVGEITDALNGKVDLPTGGTQTSIGLLVESYSNGTSWYRVYSDGWCEQGGYIDNNTDEITVTLLKPFANTSYSVLTTAQLAGQFTPTAWVESKTSSDMLIRAQYWQNASYTGVVATFYWQAKGYIS